MENLIVFGMIAMTVEGVTEWVKQLVKDGRINHWMLLSLLVAEVLTLSSSLDLFKQLGINFQNSYIGPVLTGIFLSRGANYVYDLYDKLKNLAKL